MLSRVSIMLAAVCTSTLLNAQSATIEGVVRTAGDSTAVAHALVRLQSSDGKVWAVSQQRISDSGGRYRFVGVSPGNYRVQLLRIGYEPVTSDVVNVSGSGTTRIVLDAPAHAVVLATMNVYAKPQCLSQSQLPSDSRLAELWREARTGVESRRAFDRQYSYRRTLKQNVTIEFRLGSKRESNSAVLVNDPDSAAARDARRRARNREIGYASGASLTLPDDKEILDEAFLETHCLETDVDEEGGAFGVKFRPLKNSNDFADVRGRLWIDSRTYQVRGLEVQYIRGDKQVGEAAVNYGDVTIGGNPFRLPQAGTATVRPAGLTTAVVKRAKATFNYLYDRIQPAGR